MQAQMWLKWKESSYGNLYTRKLLTTAMEQQTTNIHGELPYVTCHLAPVPLHHRTDDVSLETDPSEMHSKYSLMTNKRSAGLMKYCGVCGDVAKSYHFGGLACDSCKAFFRRSVHKDNYLQFFCSHEGQCVVSVSNRKSCQYCRMNRCFAIGMEKSWVMTEDERKALMQARADKKLRKQLATAALNTTTNSVYEFTAEHVSNYYEPQIERMTDFLAPVEIKEIESIVTKYMHAYQHVPYGSELHLLESERSGAQAMEV